MKKNDSVLLKDALANHPNLRWVHWTKEITDRGGNVTGVSHHHFVWEFGLTTGVHVTGREARERLTDLLVGYYPSLHGEWVSFGACRGFGVKTTITEEHRQAREAEEAKKALKARTRGRRRKSDEDEDDTTVAVAA